MPQIVEPDEYGFVPEVQQEPQADEYGFVPEQSVLENQPQPDEYGFIPEQPAQGQKDEKQEEYTTLQRLMQFGRGVTNVYTGLSDIANNYAVPYLATGMSKGAEALGFDEAGQRLRKEAKEAENINSVDSVQKSWNNVAGRDLKPTDKTGKVLELAGEIAAPLPIAKNL